MAFRSDNLTGLARTLVHAAPADTDIRFVETNWESPTLGAWAWAGIVALDGQ